MARTINEIIRAVDIREPYIWRLRLTEEEYVVMERYALAATSVHNATEAMSIIVYLAEWYKRMYQGGMESPFSTETVRRAWELSGISSDKYVYTTDNGTHLWQYSIFVLGGLAVRHELSRNDRGRFLKALCRIYHGEEYTLENLDDASRAIAFRRSISQQHSIYEYLREILNGGYECREQQTQTLIAQIRSANDDVLKAKFQLEWIIKFPPGATSMSRRLRVWLKPEEVGGGMHQYLRYDRMRLWGITNPDNIQYLHFYTRWFCEDAVVSDIDLRHPLITYTNTGDRNGFLAWGVERFASCKHIPARRITKLQIVALDDKGSEYIAQEEAVFDMLQLWRTEPWGDEWSSRRNSQHQTAVVFSDRWHPSNEADSVRPFREAQEDSEAWNWCYIYDSITLKAGEKVVTLYNREGYDQVTTRLYTDCLRYVKGGLVEHYHIDDPEDDEEYDVEELPLIFGRHDIVVRHFVDKDSIREAKPSGEDAPDEIEYKMANGLYTAWISSDEPPHGVVTVRVTVKGVQSVHKMVFLKGMEAEHPVIRDFETQCVRYISFDGEERELQDRPAQTKHPLHPVIYINVERENEYVQLQVYRPVLWKEIVVDGCVARHVADGENVSLPYILRTRTVIHDFCKEGYRVYDFCGMANIYELLGDNDNAHLALWGEGASIAANNFDAAAPAWLNITFGDKDYDGRQTLDFFYWNYDKNTPPAAVQYNHALEKGTVVFQSMRNVDEKLTCVCPRLLKSSPFATKGMEISELKCFEVAREHGIYFFIMEPLRKMATKRSMVEKLYNPLLQNRNGRLSEDDIKALKRLECELRFSWKRQGINLD